MKGKGLIAVGCLVLGIPLLAYGLTTGAWLLIVAGFALELVFLYFAWEWIAGASRPMGAQSPIKPAANAAWSMKNEPVRPDDRSDGKN